MVKKGQTEMRSMIEINNISKSYHGKKVLQDINLNIMEGDVYGLLGLNGAGKTTLMKILLGLISRDYGTIKIDGKEIKDMETTTDIGALIEFPAFYEYLNGKQNLTIFANLYGLKEARINEVMRMVGLDAANKTKVKNYSMGMKQRLAIARAFLPNPKIIVLDEPTNGLDPAGVIEIEDFIVELAKKENKTFIIASHILPQIEKICNKVGIINHGVIVEEGLVSDLLDTNIELYSLTLDQEISSSQVNKLLQNQIVIVENLHNKLTIQVEKGTIGTISNLLSQQGIVVTDIQKQNRNLENYFIEKVGVHEN